MMSNSKEPLRVIPLTDNFMKDKKTHDKVWSYLQIISYKTKDNKTIVYKDDKSTYSAIHNAIVQKNNSTGKANISVKTIQNTMKIYKEIGMVKDGEIEDKSGKKIKVYILSREFEIFQYVPLETLSYLVDTANFNVIKIYAYLLNKYEWKNNTGENYTFYIQELSKAIGYDKDTGNTIVKNILNSLGGKLIEYHKIHNVVNGKTTPIHVLDKVYLKPKEYNAKNRQETR